MSYEFTFGFLVTDRDNTPYPADTLEAILDDLMNAMLDRETDIVVDPSLGAALDAGEVDITVDIGAGDEHAAGAVARDFVIESIRAIGGTPIGIFVFPPPRS